MNKFQKRSYRVRHKIAAALALLIVFSLVIIAPWNKPDSAKAAWYSDTAWLYRQKVTIDHNKVPNTSQTDFPVLIKISNQYNQIFTSAKDDGSDILFTDSGGNKLAHEVDNFSKSTKEFYAWVKIPVLSSASDTILYMYYGNSIATAQQDKTSTWSNGYAAVWHLNESSGNSLDSSVSNISGTPSAGVTQNNIGKVGKDYLLNGSSAVNYGNSSSLPNGTSARTMCAWAKTNSVAAGYAWNFAYGTGGVSQAMFIGRNGTTLYGGGYANDITASNYWTVGEWKYTCLTYDGTNATMYGNGSQVVAPTAKSWNLVRNYTVLGSQVPSGENWNGDIDEVRISSVARSADWIATEFNNQNDPGSFASVSYEVDQTNYAQAVEKEWISSSWLYKQKIQILNNTATALVDYQVPINSSSVSLTNVFDKAKSDGADIRFSTTGSTEELPYYIESYSKVGASAKIWVKIPYIPASSSAYVYLYYGNSDAVTTSNLANISDSTETKISTGLSADATSSFYPPANAIDGNFSNFWHGANDAQLHSLWVTGIPNKILSTIKVYHYAGQWASTFKIQGSNDNFVSDIREFANITSPTQNMVFSNINDSASSVKYNTLSSSAWFNPTIYEFEFYTKFKIATTEPTVSLSGTQLYFDADAPVNPSVFTAKNIQGGSITLDASNYYNHTAPYFSWPAVDAAGGASDAITGVDGYFAYFGTSCGVSGADPTLTRGILDDLGSGLNYSANTSISVPEIASDGIYCLRLKTKDVAGNISAVVEAFVYKFETVAPAQPAYIASNPAGYTSTNSYTFSWPVASDTGGSGLAGYQYKRGSGSGDDWSSTIVETSKASIAPYQTGQNIFYVRSVDNAGNISDEVQTNYYYASNAPGKPTSLQANPSISDANDFSFVWTAPEHNIAIANYAYSINAVPTEQNIHWLNSSATSIAANSFATKQGVNTLYLIAKDEAGNYAFDQASVASIDFTCQTPAPPTPAAVSATDSSDRTINRWMITTQWAAGEEQDSATFDHYLIERSTDGETFSQLATTVSPAYIDADLSNLITYYYRIKAVDNAGSSSVASSAVSKTPTGKYATPPTIVTDPTSTVKATSATVSWVTNRASTGAVKFGKTVDQMNRSQLDPVEKTSHEITLPGLDSQTTYYFKVQSLDSDRDYSENDAYSSVFTLKTLAAPGIENVVISNISLNSADISWESSSASTTLIRYGTSINYDKTWEDASSYTTKHTFKLTDLSHTTTYHFKISGLDADNNTVSSDDYVFDTLPLPKISAVSFDTDFSQAQPQTFISWTSNVPTTSSVEYFPKSAGNVSYEESQSDFITAHKVQLTKLSDDTSYSFYVSGTDKFGNKANSDEYLFSTPFDSRPAQVSDVQVETSNVGLDKQDKAQLIISWKTDEPATTQVEYGEGVTGSDYAFKTSQDQTLSTDHFVIISDLKPNQPYHLRALAADKGGNVSMSSDISSIPGEVPRSIMSTILKTFDDVFGWLGKII